MAGVWVFAESDRQTFELINCGRRLADGLGTGLAAFALTRELAHKYIEHGADMVLLLPPLGEDRQLESLVPVIGGAARSEDPDVFLVGGTQRGKEMASRIAASLDTGLGSECVSLELDQETQRLVMERMVYGGAALQAVICTARPQMATIPPRLFEPAPALTGREGKVIELAEAPPALPKVLERTPKKRDSVDISEARVIVCAGRGVEKEQDLSLARELAEVLGGEVACSRPVAEELNWLPEEVYIGISGKKVKPDLYVGVGIAGQIQHVTGMRDSRVVLAVNKDENAPVFDAADYGIVGDLYDVVPGLIKEFKAVLKK